jgi:hypothetical protein
MRRPWPHWELLRHGKNKKNERFLKAIGVSDLIITTVWNPELRHREVWYEATYRLHLQSRMYPEDGGTMLLRTEHVLQATVPSVGQ